MTELQFNCDKLSGLNEQKKQLAVELRNAPALMIKPLLDKYLKVDEQMDKLQMFINDDYAQFMAEFED